MVQLRLGTTKVDITPGHPVPLSGFASRGNRVFERIASRLFVRTFVFEQTAADGSIDRALLLSADLLFWSNESVRKLRSQIQERYGIPAERTILHATHTHSGPSVSEQTIGLGVPDQAYLAGLERSLMDSIDLAIRNIEPVTVYRGTGSCEIGVNRRELRQGQIILGRNSQGLVDNEVNAIVFATNQGRHKALLVHYTCHPTLTDANAVSSEFCGHAMDVLEQRMQHDETVCAYLQGCCGDINPYGSKNAGFDGDTAISKLGEVLAEAVLALLADGLHKQAYAPFDAAQVVDKLPFARLPDKDELMRLAAEEVEQSPWRLLASRYLKNPDLLKAYAPFEVTRFRVAKNLTLAAMNAEMVVSYGLFMKSLGVGLIPLAYSNGMIGYVTTAKQLEEGGYEPHDSVPYFGNPAPFDENVEEKVLRMLKKLFASPNGGEHADE
ncbi:neutral/alkaline non-lysosomal ceramidase N-terminal domain-containing protein [Paenibacillus mendelii]|uniref:Neutral/alkaline non-lysosomal ceramidase N-terminal domain-containing protein n=1 Tax=Paenibacillus mendelii TaxID=206163 RepID=A0ABV6JAL2_9BACL|nr:neutral/alkaline non-lysosomal ceramidase N-terminal domain-containing protein [Paenibacillus mendelii]MCQ6560683.1 neutral/alkaline non-lysosomal ceramidase N-terminal domain-containing protein [Paenibacillus mendelii]